MEFKADFILIAQFDGVRGRLFTAHVVKADLEALPARNWHHLRRNIKMQLPITPGAVAKESMLNLVREMDADIPRYIIRSNGYMMRLQDHSDRYW